MSFTERLRGVRRHLAMVCWLWLLWMLLWGSLSAGVVLSGILVASAVVLAFSFPPVHPRATVRPWRLVRLLGFLVTDCVGSAFIVAWEAVRHGPRTSTAIVEVPLRVDTDLLIAATATLTTMTPGTLVLEIDRERRLLYVHGLPVRDQREAEHRRREVRKAEHHVAWALGRAGTAREADAGSARESS